MCACVYVCTCMCPCMCGLTPPLHLAPTLVCLLFLHVLPSKVILLSRVSPQVQGRQPPLSCPPHVAFFAQGWTHGGVWEGPPRVLIYDVWLRVQPAVSFREGFGGRVPLGKDPKTEFHRNYLATGWCWPGTMLPWSCILTGPGVVTQGCSPCLRSHGLPPPLPTGRLSCRRVPGCSSLCKASCAWQPSAWPCLWPSASSHRCQRSVRGGAQGQDRRM